MLQLEREGDVTTIGGLCFRGVRELAGERWMDGGVVGDEGTIEGGR